MKKEYDLSVMKSRKNPYTSKFKKPDKNRVLFEYGGRSQSRTTL